MFVMTKHSIVEDVTRRATASEIMLKREPSPRFTMTFTVEGDDLAELVEYAATMSRGKQ